MDSASVLVSKTDNGLQHELDRFTRLRRRHLTRSLGTGFQFRNEQYLSYQPDAVSMFAIDF